MRTKREHQMTPVSVFNYWDQTLAHQRLTNGLLLLLLRETLTPGFVDQHHHRDIEGAILSAAEAADLLAYDRV